MNKTLLTLALICVPTVASAQRPPMPDMDEMFFKQFDTDQNGIVSEAEFVAPTLAQFKHMDSNADGSIDREEIKAFNAEMKQRAQEMRQQMRQRGGPPPRMPQR